MAYEDRLKLLGAGIPARKHASEGRATAGGSGLRYARAAVVVARHGGPREHGRGCLALRVRGQRDGADRGCDLDESQRIAQSILGGIEPLVGGEIRAVEENGDERALLVAGQRLGADALVSAPLVDNAVNLELPVPLKQKLI